MNYTDLEFAEARERVFLLIKGMGSPAPKSLALSAAILLVTASVANESIAGRSLLDTITDALDEALHRCDIEAMKQDILRQAIERPRPFVGPGEKS